MAPETIALGSIVCVIAAGTIIYLFRRFKQNVELYPSSPPYKKSFRPPLKEDVSLKQKKSSNDQKSIDFNDIINAIEQAFHPKSVIDEKTSETELITFLASRFPNKIIRRGHTSKGDKVDIVVDGTHALELVVVSNEGKLISLLDHILKSRQDFGEVGVILIDVDTVPLNQIETYIQEYETINVKTIVKKSTYQKNKENKDS